MQEIVNSGLDRVKASVRQHTGMDIDVVTRTESDFDSYVPGVKKGDPMEDIINLPITQVD